MIDFLVMLSCKLRGKKNNVKISMDSRFNKKRLIEGIANLQGTKEYPIQINHSHLKGNISAKQGDHFLNCSLNTGERGSISFGKFVSANSLNISAGNSQVKIGSYCSIIDTTIMTMGHNYKRVSTYYLYKNLLHKNDDYETVYKKDGIIIGNDVWIGTGAIILGGVNIGNGAVIGAGSLVNKDVPPYAICAGNPAKIIGYRFSQTIIESLEKTAWWNIEEDQISAIIKEIDTSEINLFIEYIEKRRKEHSV